MSESATLEDINDAMWSSFITWAFGQESIREEFAKQTGKPVMPPPANGIDAAIDRACGVDRDATLEAFMVWATENLWGMDMAPAKFREKYGNGIAAHDPAGSEVQK